MEGEREKREKKKEGEEKKKGERKIGGKGRGLGGDIGVREERKKEKPEWGG